MTGCLTQKEYAAGFYGALWHFVLIICVAAPLFALDDFVMGRLVLAWRRFLTDTLVAAFFSNEAYYRVVHMRGIDNPDQRITQDVEQFVESSTSILSVIVSKIFNCIAFAGEPPFPLTVAALSIELQCLLLVFTILKRLEGPILEGNQLETPICM